MSSKYDDYVRKVDEMLAEVHPAYVSKTRMASEMHEPRFFGVLFNYEAREVEPERTMLDHHSFQFGIGDVNGAVVFLLLRTAVEMAIDLRISSEDLQRLMGEAVKHAAHEALRNIMMEGAGESVN